MIYLGCMEHWEIASRALHLLFACWKCNILRNCNVNEFSTILFCCKESMYVSIWMFLCLSCFSFNITKEFHYGKLFHLLEHSRWEWFTSNECKIAESCYITATVVQFHGTWWFLIDVNVPIMRCMRRMFCMSWYWDDRWRHRMPLWQTPRWDPTYHLNPTYPSQSPTLHILWTPHITRPCPSQRTLVT